MANPAFIESGRQTREKIFNFLCEYWKQKGYAPSYKEIQDACGLSSVSSVFSALKTLRREGKVEFKDGIPRTVRPSNIMIIFASTQEK